MTQDSAGHRLAVLGAGVMGKGITALALGRGLPVTLVDVDPAVLGPAADQVRQEMRLGQLTGALPRDRKPGELRTGTSVADAADATVVVEAITEVAELKVKAHIDVAAVVAPGTLLVTNTSSIPVDELAASAPRPEDLLGVHFMNPPYLIETVEVIRGSRTGEHAMAALSSLLEALGRRGVVVGDGPGFVTSRVLHRMINDAAELVHEGRATVEAVDALMEGCLGHPTGPLRTADLIGIDNLVDSLRVLHERTGDDSFRPSGALLRKVADGDLGRKTGRGFYSYTDAGGALPAGLR
ncbi:3-hydroxyacyl-CoA dehydrogenase family protein [Lentzea sp.]|uniref:3-hydroxyacyl-CoA dehydrogenase family protein n=1 Tax=Lentzea sp. TaxID=56099 RepID=UPI002ED402A5